MCASPFTDLLSPTKSIQLQNIFPFRHLYLYFENSRILVSASYAWQDERILAGDALAALRTFPDICSRWQWLTPSDNLDHVLAAESAQHSEEDEAAAAEEEEVDSDGEEAAKLADDAPPNRCNTLHDSTCHTIAKAANAANG